MPNFKEHLTTSFCITGIANFFLSLSKQNEEMRIGIRKEGSILEAIGDAFIGGTGGAIGSMIPDTFDPPTHPNHRGRFHSVGNLVLSASLIGGESLSNNPKQNIFIKSVLCGNVIHLIQDSGTSKGIPIL